MLLYNMSMKSAFAPKTRRRSGRPTLYTPVVGQQLIEAMATGLSLEAAAAQVGLSPRVVFDWQQKHPEFLQAVQEGRQRALLFWERRAIAMAEGAPGNAQLVMLALKNRSRAASGWHDAQRLEHTGTDGGPVQVQPVVTQIDATKLTQEQRDALRAAILTIKQSNVS
ncbi:MAG: hypothetical protein FJX33_00010 [Alphaproteobacteria bacterium]|nr:hypothetical protein [Alphaproteobacteria bacterium]